MSALMRTRFCARCSRTSGVAWLSKATTPIRSSGASISAVARAASLASSSLGPFIEPERSMHSTSASDG